MVVHTLFDLLAAGTSLTLTMLVYGKYLAQDPPVALKSLGSGYILSLLIGSIAGAYGLGTLNLHISGYSGIGRSIAGALAGAILAVELFKRARGIRGSTGLIFVPAFAATVAVGRWGCFLSGLEDHTHGVATALPWGQDFGDGVPRHPVQLYESAAMASFLALALLLFSGRSGMFYRNGFYLLVFWYGGQRFVWEFFKPYGTLVGPFNLFHITCAGLVVYAAWMIRGAEYGRTAA